jgi:DNA replication protein DnaC
MERISKIASTRRLLQNRQEGMPPPPGSWATCRECDGTGWLTVVRHQLHFGAVTEVRRAVKCQCVRVREALLSIPQKYHAADFTGFPPAIEAAARSWLEAPIDLLIAGDVGTGKTYLACALAT